MSLITLVGLLACERRGDSGVLEAPHRLDVREAAMVTRIAGVRRRVPSDGFGGSDAGTPGDTSVITLNAIGGGHTSTLRGAFRTVLADQPLVGAVAGRLVGDSLELTLQLDRRDAGCPTPTSCDGTATVRVVTTLAAPGRMSGFATDGQATWAITLVADVDRRTP